MSIAELAEKLATADKERAVAQIRAEMSQRTAQGREAPKAAEPLSEDEKAAEEAVDRIFRRKTGMSMDEAVSRIGRNEAGVGNAAVASQDLAMTADPDAFPHYAEVRDQLRGIVAERGGKMSPEEYRFAYSELSRPLAKQARVSRRNAAAKAKRRASIPRTSTIS